MAAGQEQVEALIIGAGPAGMMAAEVLAQAGHRVVLVEAKPSIARKLLMAGKSGLNLTKAEDPARFLAAYGTAADWLAPLLAGFGPEAVQDWARGLGQPVFTGSTGRVFPKVMKASPLVRAWAARLGALGVERRTRWRWTGWDGAAVLFDTPEGPRRVLADATVLALGGASWARLGSDGAWAGILAGAGVTPTPFAPANAGICIHWSPHMSRHFGTPVKGAALRAGPVLSRGEFVISARGLEGGGVYPLSPQMRAGARLHVDLLPDRTAAWITERLARPRGKATVAAHLRKSLKLDPARLALLQEFGRPLPDTPEALARCLKALPIAHTGLRPLDEAISTAGGVPRAALDDGLMLTARPGTFCAGEMLDWEAPTGGYLLTGCLATGRHAGRAAAAWLSGGTLDASVEISPRLS
ncbi:TIGR03862 family flavoprotein [Fluviibacterium sp. DFM31]|uniref:TIGR03862 family flavoprotein n=1 Tax=Meridianimarinicoccus marinus TaxID=3231483 RepID=A0ABV3L3F7_9RHOB